MYLRSASSARRAERGQRGQGEWRRYGQREGDGVGLGDQVCPVSSLKGSFK